MLRLIIALLAASFVVPGDDPPPPVLTGQWLSAHRGHDDYDVVIVRDGEGKLVTRWFELDTGACRYKGVLAWDAKESAWREVYDPEYSRCGDWLWTMDLNGVLVDHAGAWRLRRPGEKGPDL